MEAKKFKKEDIAAWVMIGLMVIFLGIKFFGKVESILYKAILDNSTSFFLGATFVVSSWYNPKFKGWILGFAIFLMFTSMFGVAMDVDSKWRLQTIDKELKNLKVESCNNLFRLDAKAAFDSETKPIDPVEARVRLLKIDGALTSCLEETKKNEEKR